MLSSNYWQLSSSDDSSDSESTNVSEQLLRVRTPYSAIVKDNIAQSKTDIVVTGKKLLTETKSFMLLDSDSDSDNESEMSSVALPVAAMKTGLIAPTTSLRKNKTLQKSTHQLKTNMDRLGESSVGKQGSDAAESTPIFYFRAPCTAKSVLDTDSADLKLGETSHFDRHFDDDGYKQPKLPMLMECADSSSTHFETQTLFKKNGGTMQSSFFDLSESDDELYSSSDDESSASF